MLDSTMEETNDDGEAAAMAARSPFGDSGGCGHLQAAQDPPVPVELVCEDCIREGTTPVHLRMCLACGNIGCCDSSPGLHATAHNRATGHPVMRSAEPGETWRWCYPDELLG